MNGNNARPLNRRHLRQGLIETEPIVKSIGNSNHFISAGLLKTLTINNGVQNRPNVIFSPYGLCTNLSLLRTAAADVTSDKICRDMNLPEIVTKNMLNQGHKTILDGFNEVLPFVLAPRGDTIKPEFIFKTKMIVPHRFRPLKPEFVETARNYYHCDVEYVDLANPVELENLNAQVCQETNHIVQDLLLPENYRLENNDKLGIVLISYVYFQSLWEGHNALRADKQLLFQPFDTDGVMVDFMRHERMYCSYCSTAHLKGICCALYFEGGRYAMMIYRPRVLDNYEESLKYLEETQMKLNTLDAIAAQFVKYHKNSRRGDGGFLVDVCVPKFTFTHDLSIRPSPNEPGVHSLFDKDTAQLYGMRGDGPENPFISQIFQQVQVQVDDNASPIDPRIPVYPPPRAASDCQTKIKKLLLNRPFIFSIFDYQNNVNVIMGTVNNPVEPVPV